MSVGGEPASIGKEGVLAVGTGLAERASCFRPLELIRK